MPQTLKDLSDEYIYAGDFTEPKYYYEAVNDFQAAIKAWVKELVGEDEKLHDLRSSFVSPEMIIENRHRSIRNAHREELRTKLDAS